MSWHRDSHGLWCACFLAYQPDNGNGCPAYDCPEAPLPKGWAGAGVMAAVQAQEEQPK